MTKVTESERLEALERLREWLSPGDTVYTILRHVSRSGMQRTIDAIVADRIDTKPGVFCIGWAIAKALDMRFDRDRSGVKIGGCGMDMGFELVYNLGRALWPNGVPCTGEGCLSNDHANGDRNYIAHTQIAPRMHSDSGYALRQRWL